MHEIFHVTKIRDGVASPPEDDALASERPLEIRVRGKTVSVTMRTPGSHGTPDAPDDAGGGQDAELAAGFLLSEGLLHDRHDIDRIEPCVRTASGTADGDVLNVFLRPEVEFDHAKLQRHSFMSSSCGVCGRASIEAIHQHFPPIRDTTSFTTDTMSALPDRLRAAQRTFDRTGGLHAAGLFDAQGDLRVLREDVGRHNAVDKVLGHAWRNGWLPLGGHVLLVSGRVSFEIVQKALAGGVPVLAAVSAPSSLAVEFAEANNQTLIGFLRGSRMNIYCHAARVGLPLSG